VAKAFEDFSVVDWQDLGERLSDGNRVLTTRQYRLEPFLLGSGEVPGVTFHFYDVNEPDMKYELTTGPIEVEVASVLTDPNDQRAIEDIEGVVDMPRGPLAWWLLPVMGLVSIGAAVLGWFLACRQRAKNLIRVFRPAHELALARLKDLRAERLVERGFVKRFYERISGILRHYIEDRFELRAPERTTEEFLEELQGTSAFPEADRKVLEDFLTHCDLVKFAKHSPTSEQIERTFDLVGDFIGRTRSDEHKVDVTDEVRIRQMTEVVATGGGIKTEEPACSEAVGRSSKVRTYGDNTSSATQRESEGA